MGFGEGARGNIMYFVLLVPSVGLCLSSCYSLVEFSSILHSFCLFSLFKFSFSSLID